MNTQHENYMSLALREAERAFEENEVPVGAVVVFNETVIGKGHNRTETLRDATAHAEMIAITSASAYLNSWRLENCTLYVTLEPCAMCAGAIVLARIPLLVFGAYDEKCGAVSSLYNITNDIRFNHRAHSIGGIRRVECEAMLKEFFSRKRNE
jgi:tRNA(adenine34) deaminase